MKYLVQFSRFEMERFLKGKTLTAMGLSEWIDFNSKARLGVKLETVITVDNTVYDKADNEASNLYEKMTFKIAGKDIKDFNIPINSIVEPVNPVATIFGDYRNQLSVKADDIKVVQQQTQQAQQTQPAKSIAPKTL